MFFKVISKTNENISKDLAYVYNILSDLEKKDSLDKKQAINMVKEINNKELMLMTIAFVLLNKEAGIRTHINRNIKNITQHIQNKKIREDVQILTSAYTRYINIIIGKNTEKFEEAIQVLQKLPFIKPLTMMALSRFKGSIEMLKLAQNILFEDELGSIVPETWDFNDPRSIVMYFYR